MNVPKLIPFVAEGPQDLIRALPEAEAYPFEALGPLRAAVRAAQEATQAPMAIVGQSALAVASLATQCHADVEILNGSAPLSLFVMSIAKSGERKSAIDKLFMEGIGDFEKEAGRRFEIECIAHQTALEAWKAQRDLVISDSKKNKSDLDTIRVALEASGSEPVSPLNPFLTASDPTLEGLHKLYVVGQPGLGIYSDEGGGFLGGYGMTKENRLRTFAGLSDLWGGASIRRVRAGDGASFLCGRRLSMHLMVQPITAQELLADPLAQGQGFLARLLITHPRSAIGTRLQRGRLDTQTLHGFAVRVRTLLAAPKPLAKGTRQELEPRILPLSSDARALLWDYYEKTEREQAPGGDLESCTAFASKSPEQACRIAGVLAIWEDLNAPEVTGATMANGIALAHYYLHEARRLADNAEINQDTANAEMLRVWLLGKWPGIAAKNGRDASTILPGDILQYGPGPIRDLKKIKKCTGELVEAGWLIELPNDTEINGARRKASYRIVRTSHVV